MDVSVTIFRSINTIVSGSGAGTVYTVPANCFAVVSVSTDATTFTGGVTDDYGQHSLDAAHDLSLSIGGSVVQSTGARAGGPLDYGVSRLGGCSVAGYASAGQSIAISSSYSGTGSPIAKTPRYQILVLNNGNQL